MKTFILMWNPAISSFTNARFVNLVQGDEEELYDMNWSVWEHEKLQEGDRFFMVRVKDGVTGIVMAGYFFSEAYEGEDWSGKGRRVFYADMGVQHAIDSTVAPIITTEELMRELPGFDWTGGHSGVVLSEELAAKLELMWLQYLNNNQEIFDGDRAYQDYDYYYDYMRYYEVSETLDDYLSQEECTKCEICGYDYQKVWGDDCDYKCDFFFFPTKGKKMETLDDVHRHIHCLCKNCHLVNTKRLCARLGEEYIDFDE